VPLEQLLVLTLLAGVVGLDVVSFPQAMVSRPIVAATLGGAFLGDAVAGLVTGAALECLALESLPVGASRYPEWGTASVVAGAVATHGVAEGALPAPGAFAVAVLVGVAMAWLAGWTVVKQRQRIAAYARPRLDRLAAGDRDTVVAIQLVGMSIDLARGTVLGAAGAIPAWWLAGVVASRWTLPEPLSRALVVTTVAAVAAAAVWKDFHAISGTRRLFLFSLALGTALVILGH
jgi:PTS system mannose-specific IIC component